MDFDERLITKEFVEKAIAKYLFGDFKHAPARSAFLLHQGKKLPAKFIIRLAFQEATGIMVPSEALTGGRASVRVLNNLGFDAVYDKPNRNTSGGNPVKNARRHALKTILMERWGVVETEKRFSDIIIPDLLNRKTIDPIIYKILCHIEQHRNITIRGRKNLPLAFDFYLPGINLVIEFDERQHFSPLRAASLLAYPNNVALGFDKTRWRQLSEQIRAGDNSPLWRDEQRAFYDSIRDIMAPRIGLRPVIRIFEEDVKWEQSGDSEQKAQEILQTIEMISRE